MDVSPKAVIQYHLRQKGLSPADLAKRLGIPVATLNLMLATPVIRQGGHWPAVLDALDLEVVIRPRQP